ncbi:hypothetical protein KSF73_08725 [Burkholderiaceae bacterium DAT-1]|nr:hypothetical protein [Burkholderiaceae bacterium DAT-1]
MKRSSHYLCVAAAVWMLALSTSASAHGERPEFTGPPGHGDELRAGFGQAFDARVVYEVMRYRTELRLTPQQETLARDAEDAWAIFRNRHIQTRTKMQADLTAERAKEVMDFESLLRGVDATRIEVQKAYEQSRDRWLAFYRSLSPDQKATLSKLVRSRLAQIDAMRERAINRVPAGEARP